MIDEFYNYQFGQLEYRSLCFEHEIHEVDNYQGNAVINYTDRETPYTRIIEHKHFEFGQQEKTVITKKYPSEWNRGRLADYKYYDMHHVIEKALDLALDLAKDELTEEVI